MRPFYHFITPLFDHLSPLKADLMGDCLEAGARPCRCSAGPRPGPKGLEKNLGLLGPTGAGHKTSLGHLNVIFSMDIIGRKNVVEKL